MKHCIFNKQYTPEEYETKKNQIIEHMKKTEEWGEYFPGYFAPNPYDESWSAFYFPLTKQQQESAGYRCGDNLERKNDNFLDPSTIPTDPNEAEDSILENNYWDPVALRPFKIAGGDVNFCRKLEVALPHSYYMRRIQDNFSLLPFS